MLSEKIKIGEANLSFGKDKTAIIKGFAILFMIILHCGGGHGWYSEPIPAFEVYPWLERVFGTFKLCVGIFTFMVGYGYAFAKKKDWHYSLAHLKKLLIPFWTILFLFTLPVVIAKGEWRLDMMLLNAFGINSEWNWTSWFVAFFIYAMIVMPFMSRLIDKKPILGAFVMVLFTYGIGVAVHELIPNYSNNDWTQRLFDCMMTSPTMILGYLFAHEEWFTKIRIPKHWSIVMLAMALILGVFVMRYYVGGVAAFNFDFFYAPLFILSVLVIFNLCELPVFSKMLTAFGNVSVYMWFFHALFFTGVVRSVYQPFILISHTLWVIIPWTIILTFCCSWVLQRVTQGIQNMIVK